MNICGPYSYESYKKKKTYILGNIAMGYPVYICL